MSKKLAKYAVLVLLVLAVVSFFLYEKSNSYAEPAESLIALKEELLLIPAYSLNGKALFFFIKDKKHLGATYVEKGLLGWKAGYRAWSPMDPQRNYETLNGYQGYGDQLIYGLIQSNEDFLIKVGEQTAKMINLETLSPNIVERHQLQNLSIWYLESDTPLEQGEIQLINKNTGQILSTSSLF